MERQTKEMARTGWREECSRQGRRDVVVVVGRTDRKRRKEDLKYRNGQGRTEVVSEECVCEP